MYAVLQLSMVKLIFILGLFNTSIQSKIIKKKRKLKTEIDQTRVAFKMYQILFVTFLTCFCFILSNLDEFKSGKTSPVLTTGTVQLFLCHHILGHVSEHLQNETF